MLPEGYKKLGLKDTVHQAWWPVLHALRRHREGSTKTLSTETSYFQYQPQVTS